MSAENRVVEALEALAENPVVGGLTTVIGAIAGHGDMDPQARAEWQALFAALPDARKMRDVVAQVRVVLAADDALETFEAGCNCEDQTAGYVCGDPGPCGWKRHIPTYDMKGAVALEAAMNDLRTLLDTPDPESDSTAEHWLAEEGI